MKDLKPFTFKRSRGIVWVCDLNKSSSYLNNVESVDDIETYIPRFYYFSKLLIESYGGKFIKWTGDGFLAWFEFELDRNKQTVANKVFDAARHLTLISNVTQFGIEPKKKFKIQHGITYEQDALLMTLNETDRGLALDVIGRAVVLAFRLSNIPAEFPSIITVKELAGANILQFKKWTPTIEDRLKFFKGEKYGLESIFVPFSNKHKRIKTQTLVKRTQALVEKVESNSSEPDTKYLEIFLKRIEGGPDWTKQVIREYITFVKRDLLGTLKKIGDVLNEFTTP